MANSADPDQLDQFCLQNRVYPGSAGQGLILYMYLYQALGNSAGNKLVIFFPENMIWHFMQIVSNGNNLHEMSKPVFWKKKKKKKKKERKRF